MDASRRVDEGSRGDLAAFVRAVAHELKNDLTVALSVLELQSESQARLGEDLERGQVSLERMVAIVSLLQDVACEDTGISELDLGPFVREVVESMAPLLSSRGVAPVCLGADVELRAIADPDALVRLLGMLITSAPRGAVVRLEEVTPEESAGLPPGRYAEISVEGAEPERLVDWKTAYWQLVLLAVGGRLDVRDGWSRVVLRTP